MSSTDMDWRHTCVNCIIKGKVLGAYSVKTTGQHLESPGVATATLILSILNVLNEISFRQTIWQLGAASVIVVSGFRDGIQSFTKGRNLVFVAQEKIGDLRKVFTPFSFKGPDQDRISLGSLWLIRCHKCTVFQSGKLIFIHWTQWSQKSCPA